MITKILILSLFYKPFNKNENTKMWSLQMMEVKTPSPKLGLDIFFSSCLDEYIQAIKNCMSCHKASRLPQVKPKSTF